MKKCMSCSKFKNCICVICTERKSCDKVCEAGSKCIDFQQEYRAVDYESKK